MAGSPRIRLLLADQPGTIQELVRSLSGIEDLEIVGTATDAPLAVERARQARADVIIVDADMPDGGGFAAAAALARELPGSGVVMLASRNDAETLRRSMLAGARQCLIRPVRVDELTNAIREVHRRLASQRASGAAAAAPREGTTLAFFGAKGGVGVSSLCINTAVALSRTHHRRVALVDASFPFGSAALLLNTGTKGSWIDLLPLVHELDEQAMDLVLASSHGIRVLVAPARPEEAELVSAEHVDKALRFLKARFDYVVVDTNLSFSEQMLRVLDIADLVLLVANPEISTARNAQHFVRTFLKLGYPRERLQLVVNRADAGFGLSMEDVERATGLSCVVAVPSDGRAVTTAANLGIPYLVNDPGKPVCRATEELARQLVALALAEGRG